MTMHVAKGLEFRAVLVMACDDDVIPRVERIATVTDDSDLEEFYYIIGASKGTLRKFERELLEEDWRMIRDGLEVKLCPSPYGGKETYILCRSRDRREKEKAMHERFEHRIDEALEKVRASCEKRKGKKEVIDRRVGKIMECRNPPPLHLPSHRSPSHPPRPPRAPLASSTKS